MRQLTLLRIQINTGNTRRRQRDERRQPDVNKMHFLVRLKKQGIPCLFSEAADNPILADMGRETV